MGGRVDQQVGQVSGLSDWKAARREQETALRVDA